MSRESERIANWLSEQVTKAESEPSEQVTTPRRLVQSPFDARDEMLIGPSMGERGDAVRGDPETTQAGHKRDTRFRLTS